MDVALTCPDRSTILGLFYETATPLGLAPYPLGFAYPCLDKAPARGQDWGAAWVLPL